MDENDIGTVVVDCAVILHQDLGPGLLETVYAVTLAHQLKARGLLNFGEALMKDGITHTIKALIISPCLGASVRNMIEQGGELDAASRRQLP